MPLAHGSSRKAISSNISELSGKYPHKQAIAIALSEARRTRAVGGRAALMPSDAQKEAGNYRKRHVAFHGLSISIENEKGSKRSGIGPTGRRWECRIPADYGYIKGTDGADGDQVDCYLGPHKDSHIVFVVNQKDPRTGDFDEHKCLLGFRNEDEALKTYEAGFSDGSGSNRHDGLEMMSLDSFKKWLQEGQTKEPLRVAKAHGGHVTHSGPINSSVAGRTDHLPMTLKSGSYVLPADVVSHLGENNTAAGFKALHRLFGGTPYGGKGKIPYAGGDGPYGMGLPHKAEGGESEDDGATVPIVAAGGEYVIPPEAVTQVGEGDIDLGHQVLDRFVLETRKDLIKTLKSLDGPKKN